VSDAAMKLVVTKACVYSTAIIRMDDVLPDLPGVPATITTSSPVATQPASRAASYPRARNDSSVNPLVTNTGYTARDNYLIRFIHSFISDTLTMSAEVL
jgi:hypothetical protein